MATLDENLKGNCESQTRARVILQQCLAAKLQVQPATESSDAKFVESKKGLVIFICFLKEATKEIVEKIVKNVMQIKLSSDDNGKLKSVLELPGDVLIVPQATLGGKPKGKMMQYHGNIDKTLGKELYELFVDLCKETMGQSAVSQEAGCSVKSGTYGNRQVLSMDTNGPYSHYLEF